MSCPSSEEESDSSSKGDVGGGGVLDLRDDGVETCTWFWARGVLRAVV